MICVGGVCPRRAAAASPEQQAEERGILRRRQWPCPVGPSSGKVLGRRKWAKKGRRVYKRGFRGYLQAKPGGAISAKTAGQCGRTDGYTPGGLLDLSGQRFRSHLNDMMFFLFDAPTRQDPLKDFKLQPFSVGDQFSSN